MSYVSDLIAAYGRFVSFPWQSGVAPAQRVWMVIYPPEHERRLRLHLEDFRLATTKAGHTWHLADITNAFEEWLSNHDYRDEYFSSPDLLQPALSEFVEHLTARVNEELAESDDDGVVALLGAGSLFGLGDELKVSALLNLVSDRIRGRLLVFFPGQHHGNSYRLLDGRDGWNYLATPITADRGIS